MDLRFTAIAVALLASALLPTAAAKPDLPPLVGGCVGDACGPGTLACVGFSYQIPFCVDSPAPITTDAPDLPPAGACVDQVTHDGCWDGNWICVGFSYQVPQCVEHLTIVCGVPCDLEVVDPCETGYFECVCYACDLPVQPAAGPEPMCMYYYYELDTGIVRYVARDSCHSEVYVNGERVK